MAGGENRGGAGRGGRAVSGGNRGFPWSSYHPFFAASLFAKGYAGGKRYSGRAQRARERKGGLRVAEIYNKMGARLWAGAWADQGGGDLNGSRGGEKAGFEPAAAIRWARREDRRGDDNSRRADSGSTAISAGGVFEGRKQNCIWGLILFLDSGRSRSGMERRRRRRTFFLGGFL